jgi:hypothetical protein
MLAAGIRKPRADLIPAGQLAGSTAAVAAASSERGGLLGAVVEPGTEGLAGGLAGAGGANSFIVRCAHVSEQHATSFLVRRAQVVATTVGDHANSHAAKREIAARLFVCLTHVVLDSVFC